jgi:hypothetical protein
MRTVFLIALLAMAGVQAGAAPEPTPVASPAPTKASEAGPGGYEMTTYYVGFLYGREVTPDQTPGPQAQDAYMANIKMGAEGASWPGVHRRRQSAGPMLPRRPAEEAKASSSDPAVQAGRLRFELHPWYAAKNITVTPRKL